MICDNEKIEDNSDSYIKYDSNEINDALIDMPLMKL